jgi:hypothetical protein
MFLVIRSFTYYICVPNLIMTEESKSEEKEFETEEIRDEVHELEDAEQKEQEEQEEQEET